MSLVTVSSSVAELTSFIKDKTISNLSDSRNTGALQIDDVEFHKLIGLIEQSFSQALSLGYSNVESAVTEYVKELNEVSVSRIKKR
tara:strand:+ start:137 stop:394 length:258 start_codon:yes stop_codon:yes gene_type:complete